MTILQRLPSPLLILIIFYVYAGYVGIAFWISSRFQDKDAKGRRKNGMTVAHTHWINGKPNAPGLWVVQFDGSGEYAAVRIEKDEDPEGGSYLRAYVLGVNEHLDDDTGQLSRFAKRSYGPIPEGLPWP